MLKCSASISIQILHSGTFHWVLCAKCDTRLLFLDSLNKSPSPDVVRQIVQLHPEKVLQDMLHMHIMPVQQQSNATDCGVFAISNAFQLLGENNVPSVVCYDEKKMRSHLISCFEKESIAPFPKCPEISAVSQGRIRSVKCYIK